MFFLWYNMGMNKNKLYIYLIWVFVVVALLSASYLIWQNYPNSVVWKKEQPPVVVVPMYYSNLDGTAVSSTENTSPMVVGVMIDNHPDARPENGLAAAKIVYEAPAEGGITRYFAIFDASQTIEKVGPVRSARPYFIDWLEEYTGLYMHCGGSPDGLAKIENDKIFDLNEMFNGRYFWRDEMRMAPHNLYTSSELWNKFLTAHSDKNKPFSNAWKFGDLNVTSTELVKSISIPFTSDYVVGFSFDGGFQQYTRKINNELQLENGVPLVADSVVVQYVKTQIVDDYGRKDITTDGTGDMRLLRDGIMIRGSWKKENNRTRWYDQNGVEINLKPGKTWVEIVPNDISLKIST